MEGARLQAAKVMLLAPALAALIAASACSGPDGEAAGNGTNAAATGEQGFRPAPRLTAAVRAADGQLALSGEASPGAAVRLESSTGAAQFATADAKGDWRMTLAAWSEARLYALSMSDGGHVSPATGYLFVMPDGAVARLAAGGGSVVITPAANAHVSLALDYDNRAAATLSGAAAPLGNASLRVDGVERGQTTTDATGRFVLPLNQPLTPGAHDFDLAGGQGDVRFSATIAAPAPLRGPFAAAPIAGGWRVDWTTPGGGEQTTLVFEALAPA
jgi:hypothetical protein